MDVLWALIVLALFEAESIAASPTKSAKKLDRHHAAPAAPCRLRGVRRYHGRHAAPVAENQHNDHCISGWNNVYVIGDLHGDLQNTYKLLIELGLIDSQNYDWSGPVGTLLVQIGDIADRGLDSLPIFLLFKKLRQQAALRESKVVNIFGNHEMRVMAGDYNAMTEEEIEKHYSNSKEKVDKIFSPTGIVGEELRNHYEMAYKVGDFVFVHAGLLPEYANMSFKQMKVDFLAHLKYIRENNKHWTDELPKDIKFRNMFDEKGNAPAWTMAMWPTTPCNEISPKVEKALEMVGAKTMVVGHLLVDTIKPRCDGKIIMTDVGISAHTGGKPAALQIDKQCQTYAREIGGVKTPLKR